MTAQQSQYSRLLSALFLTLGVTAPTIAQVTPAWVARYDGAGQRDIGEAIAIDSQDHVYVGGHSQDFRNNEFVRTFIVLKYDAQGGLLWERRYPETGLTTHTAHHLAVDGADNVIISGIGDFTYQWATLKYDAQGALLWTRTYQNPNAIFSAVRGLAVDGGGNVFVTGYDDDAGVGAAVLTTIRYSPAGQELWRSTYDGGGMGASPEAALTDDAGHLYIVGRIAKSSVGTDWLILKYDAAGTLLWDATYGGPNISAQSVAAAAALDAAGNLIVAGHLNANTFEGLDLAVAKYSPAGVQIWASPYGATNNNDEAANAVAVDSQGRVFAGGYVEIARGDLDPLLVAFDENGGLLWDRVYPSSAARVHAYQAVKTDAQDSVYATGAASRPGSIDTYLTVKYSPAGDLRWDELYDSPNNGGSRANALALDSRRNVLVTGESSAAPFEPRDIATIKYQQSQPGDLNCDGFVDNEDIDPFVLAVTQGQAAYQAAWPNCNFLNGDINGDGFVDNEDIDPFVALITGP